MPTPFEILFDPLSIGVLLLYSAIILWEALLPARPLPRIDGWIPRALVSFIAFFFLSSYLPLFWGESLAGLKLLDLDSLGVAGSFVVALLVYELFFYTWHRSMHGSDGLWLAFHQMHHSAERLDTFGAFFLSPMDTVGFTFMSSLALSLVGIGPEASTLFLFATTFMSIFQHANIRTPRWLGYLIQRPESHSLHHARGVHYYNFADLPVLDMLFGTFHNPRTFVDEQGFYDGASGRIGEMLLFQDISKPAIEEARHEAA